MVRDLKSQWKINNNCENNVLEIFLLVILRSQNEIHGIHGKHLNDRLSKFQNSENTKRTLF